MKRIMLLGCIMSLVACGADKDGAATHPPEDWVRASQGLVYSYPDHRQQQVPAPAPVVLRFSSAVTQTHPEDNIVLREVGGAVVPFTTAIVDNGQGLVLTPTAGLQPLTMYQVSVGDIALQKGPSKPRQLRFETRALTRGATAQVAASEQLQVLRTIPDGSALPVLDFSSFRVQFSQPLDARTLVYGDTPSSTVQLTGPAGLVPAHLLASGPYVTVDPIQDLVPGEQYTLRFSNQVTSVLGESLEGASGYALTLSPQDTTSPTTGERATMVQQAVGGGLLSPLTGQPVNLVPMSSVLLGEDTASQTTGDLRAELAFVPHFPEVTPLRIHQGSLLSGASIEVLVGGEVPAGFESGAVRIQFLSDAMGYLLPNPYSDNDDAPRQVRLFMDVAVSTATPAANGAITQNLLHVELVGTALVENGQMVINAVGVAEPEVLGAELASGVLSFYMKAYADQDHPPQEVADTTAPMLQSWTPGEQPALSQADDPIVLVFDEPLRAETLAGRIELTENGVSVPLDYRVDGSAVVIVPQQPLRAGDESSSLVYALTLAPGMTDMAGNVLVPPAPLTFALPAVTGVSYELLNMADPQQGPDIAKGNKLLVRSPFVLSTYPGYPCVTDPASRDLAADIAGRCAGGRADYTSPLPFDQRPEDDHLPVMPLPANQPVTVQFSKDMDQDSILLGGSFSVHEVDNAGLPGDAVPGRLEVSARRIVFWPASPWTPGQLYRYQLRSNGDPMSSTALCDGSEALCGVEQQLPLQTQMLGEPVLCDHVDDLDPLCYDTSDGSSPVESHVRRQTILPHDNGGGPDMDIFFRGAPASSNVLQSLVATPVADLNANLVHDYNHTVEEAAYINTTATPHYDPRTPNAPRLVQRQQYYHHLLNEPGPDDVLDPDADQVMDPSGVMVPPNSAKILSRNTRGKDMLEGGMGLLLNGANIGCGVESWVTDAQGFSGTYGVYPSCPMEKFTYVLGALNAEITDTYVPGNGLMVRIWPTRLATTSFLTLAHIATFPSQLATASGPQLMRMRYEEGADGKRNQPITAWIRSGADGKPELVATVDLYLDAPWLASNISAPGASHNQHSYPVTMSLAGGIEFLPDGRMVISQKNIAAVDVDVQVLASNGSTMGEAELTIPAGGSYLQFVSDTIKRAH